MENLYIKEEEHDLHTSLTLDFIADSGFCVMSGESFVENSREVYMPVFQWIEDYFNNDNETITIINKIKYFNSSFVKIIFELLMLLKEFQETGKNVNIEWHYNKADIELKNDIKAMSVDSGMDIKLVEI